MDPRVPTMTLPANSAASSNKRRRGAACPACRAVALMPRKDLVYRSTNGLTAIVIANLEGVACESCGRSWFTAASANIIHKFLGEGRPSGDYEVRVTRVGGNSLGLYLPKDLVRVMQLEAGMTAYAMPVDTGLLAINFQGRMEDSDRALDHDLVTH